ncbi:MULTISPECIES: hypothetical protein [Bradyrhizobium]|nr:MULTISPECIES: hypothetical protein [Bradyrhizobium]MBR0975419.1 hypothetical protein [Bradyrhizobium japonicum]
MSETFEFLLSCVALATWLMLLFAIVSEALKPVSKSTRRLSEEAFKAKVK